jgi:hypothetical protein
MASSEAGNSQDQTGLPGLPAVVSMAPEMRSAPAAITLRRGFRIRAIRVTGPGLLSAETRSGQKSG